jgi:hypothetical protein
MPHTSALFHDQESCGAPTMVWESPDQMAINAKVELGVERAGLEGAGGET